jgi:phosphate transport system permease protein
VASFKINLKLFNNYIADKWMVFSVVLVIVLPFLMAFGLFYKSAGLIENDKLLHILFSSDWHPLKGNFGFAPFIVSSLVITSLSIFIAAPVCILSAIHLVYFAPRYVFNIMRPVIDILAGIPSVIFGVWGILIIVPLVSKYIAPLFHVATSGYNILSASLVLSVMIIPFVLNMLIEVFKTVPHELHEAALSLGTTPWEAIRKVLIRQARPGIISAVSLGVSRAFGETMAVLMLAGNVTIIPKGIFQPAYPLPALIANNYGEMLSIPLYDSALMFAAFVLFIIVLIFNLFSRMAIAKYERSIL